MLTSWLSRTPNNRRASAAESMLIPCVILTSRIRFNFTRSWVHQLRLRLAGNYLRMPVWQKRLLHRTGAATESDNRSRGPNHCLGCQCAAREIFSEGDQCGPGFRWFCKSKVALQRGWIRAVPQRYKKHKHRKYQEPRVHAVLHDHAWTEVNHLKHGPTKPSQTLVNFQSDLQGREVFCAGERHLLL